MSIAAIIAAAAASTQMQIMHQEQLHQAAAFLLRPQPTRLSVSNVDTRKADPSIPAPTEWKP
ncbi:hypothetical protein CC53_gp113 [Rhizobium phage vB_RleS_L338C]|uniref:hypothetical protein n=1 Tax=Rhizobium phage vB_RleS_L338C TaxID=1414737 RepID=UPI0003D89249|nr:hypothetical protein CC53_gp113 [Rhizobium phage vB_RleS_L338C]AHC30530.1 hypothetical protein L338C_113 [Rhizobium phage vB_RleS_L338C]QNH72191.1 hypothetical protein P11VFA_037 [Rhizobium phage P11VFA]